MQKKDFFLISNSNDLFQELKKILPEANWSIFERGTGAIEYLFNSPPGLLLIDSAIKDISAFELVGLFKSENVYRQVPVVLILNQNELKSINFCHLEADDFILKPINPTIVEPRLHLVLSRAARALDANPLTKLPGNTSIIQKIQSLIDQKKEFALAYVDLDYFKSFNDKYGFSRGDEVLMMTARIIVNTIRAFGGQNSFVGHVGGDDFVFIVSPQKVEQACKMIISSFDSIVPNFYDPKDRENGYIRSTDRQGNIREFPFMAISIAVVFNYGQLKHYGEAAQIAMNLKKIAKENPKSCYVLDRRKPTN
ncbi:diguanylate cyclase (GGDEF) domain-containing protein [Desulfonauticus submarinus]|uniref:diguanylate cyclase n=1 Tax=Desulfonauticus submarinus TaxID=206665 RepID=A0A1H0GGM5_9BACT|nr:diguanylate cyclase [Desulfonauticus submarinus]SDO06070.1 diguanylate cyclase (GGDEF) domain-containing protein [Desulfonauticus submarinus]